MTDDELDLIETDVLVEVLYRRFETLTVIATERHDKEEHVVGFYRGGWLAALGAAQFAVNRLVNSGHRLDSDDLKGN